MCRLAVYAKRSLDSGCILVKLKKKLFNDWKTSDFCWLFLEENMWILIISNTKRSDSVYQRKLNRRWFNKPDFFISLNLVWEILRVYFVKAVFLNFGWQWWCMVLLWSGCCSCNLMKELRGEKREKGVGKSKVTFTCCLFYKKFSLVRVIPVLAAFVHVFQSTCSSSLTCFPVWAFGWY